jgi:hypothetical protein
LNCFLHRFNPCVRLHPLSRMIQFGLAIFNYSVLPILTEIKFWPCARGRFRYQRG